MKDVDSFETLSDPDLVARLLLNERLAWHYVIVDVMMPLVKTRKYMEILTRLNQPLESVPGMVYLDLQKNDFHKLRNFRFEGPFRAWLYFQVKNAVKSIVRENSTKEFCELSDERLEKPLYEQKVARSPVELQEEVTEGDVCFARLWKDNPMHAYVLLLKNRLDLPSEGIKELLGLTSANYVDQINRRAKQRMCQYKEESRS